MTVPVHRNSSFHPSGLPASAPASASADRMAKALADFRKLQEVRIRAAAEVERLQAEVEAMEAEAVAEWGTADVAELKAIADRMEQDDLREIEKFEQAIEAARSRYAAADAAVA